MRTDLDRLKRAVKGVIQIKKIATRFVTIPELEDQFRADQAEKEGGEAVSEAGRRSSMKGSDQV